MNIFVPVPTEKFWWDSPVSGEVKIRTVHLIVECSNFVPIDNARGLYSQLCGALSFLACYGCNKDLFLSICSNYASIFYVQKTLIWHYSRLFCRCVLYLNLLLSWSSDVHALFFSSFALLVCI